MFLTFEWTNLVTDIIDILLLIELYINDWQKHENKMDMWVILQGTEFLLTLKIYLGEEVGNYYHQVLIK